MELEYFNQQWKIRKIIDNTVAAFCSDNINTLWVLIGIVSISQHGTLLNDSSLGYFDLIMQFFYGKLQDVSRQIMSTTVADYVINHTVLLGIVCLN